MLHNLTARLAPGRMIQRALSTRPPASPTNPQHMVLLSYVYAAGSMEELVALRAPHRPAHLEHATSWAKSGRLALGGAYGDLPPGGLLVFRGATVEEVRAFAEADPYVTSGVVRSWSVRPWTVVVEGEKTETPKTANNN